MLLLVFNYLDRSLLKISEGLIILLDGYVRKLYSTSLIQC